MVTSKKKSSPCSFRIDADTLRNLRVESKKRHTTTNALVNQALRGYMEWYRFEPIIGFVSLSKVVLRQVFEKLTLAEVNEIGKIGAREVADTSIFMIGTITLKSFLDWYELRMTNSSAQVNHSIDGNLHTYIIRHDVGQNWSLHQKIILELIIDRLFKKKIKVDIDPSTISFQISISSFNKK